MNNSLFESVYDASTVLFDTLFEDESVRSIINVEELCNQITEGVKERGKEGYVFLRNTGVFEKFSNKENVMRNIERILNCLHNEDESICKIEQISREYDFSYRELKEELGIHNIIDVCEPLRKMFMYFLGHRNVLGSDTMERVDNFKIYLNIIVLLCVYVAFDSHDDIGQLDPVPPPLVRQQAQHFTFEEWEIPPMMRSDAEYFDEEKEWSDYEDGIEIQLPPLTTTNVVTQDNDSSNLGTEIPPLTRSDAMYIDESLYMDEDEKEEE